MGRYSKARKVKLSPFFRSAIRLLSSLIATPGFTRHAARYTDRVHVIPRDIQCEVRRIAQEYADRPCGGRRNRLDVGGGHITGIRRSHNVKPSEDVICPAGEPAADLSNGAESLQDRVAPKSHILSELGAQREQNISERSRFRGGPSSAVSDDSSGGRSHPKARCSSAREPRLH